MLNIVRWFIAAVMHPGKLDVREEKELSQLQDFNKAFINNEMAAETCT
jgi:hypothetical protein